MGHIIPYFGCLVFHTEDVARGRPGEPVGIFPALKHLADKMVLIRNQPIVYADNAEKVNATCLHLHL